MSNPWPGTVVDDPWPGRTVASDDAWPGEVVEEPKAKPAPAIKPGPIIDPRAIDGDTIASRDQRVRLLGVEAPELKQHGYRRDGTPVPIGADSRRFLEGEILNTDQARLGDIAGMSYGRAVGPVDLDGRDVGLTSIRTGHSLAAPDYLSGDSERLAEYVQAERLARLNRLGQHETFAQRPETYRKDPDYVPDRETIAQFFDTPTPIQGLPAEVEAELRQLYENGTYEQIQAFLEAYGQETSRPDDLRAWIADRDVRKAQGNDINTSVSYADPPPLMTDAGDGATGAFVRKFGSGFLAGGLDEAGAIADTLGGTPGRENVWNSDRRLADIWLNNQRQNAGILSYDQTYHPVASTSGEVTGAITSGFAIPWGAGARTLPQLAKVGAGYGAAEGFLSTDGSTVDRAKGALIGAPVGAAVNAAGGKALEYAVPALAKGYRAMFRREAAQDADGAAVRYAEEVAPDGAVATPAGVSDDIWPGRRLEPDEVRSIAMEGEAGASVSSPLRQPDHPDTSPQGPRRLLDPATEAERARAAQSVSPDDMLPMPSNLVDGVEDAAAVDAGRFVEARAPNERGFLTNTTIRNYQGTPVAKTGPLDMVGWLRSQGGLRPDPELQTMGIASNAPRRGMDFVGREAWFGPMLNEKGMTLDDAAHAAWEAGYFPELRERPDINTFLDSLGETYNGGSGRRFLADDAAEIESFYSAQGERFDLEQQRFEEGGPIWSDRSAEVPEGQPFPPVQAYEDWAGGADFAGNIRLDKLDSPQDISRALVQTEKRTGFDAAARGRVTQAETEALAADLNMTPDQLLSRRKGQAFNAEEALAARQLLAKSGNELVNAAKRIKALEDPGDELLTEFRQKWLRHVAIQEQVAGMTAEAGRALQQFRMSADARAVRGEVLNGLVRAGGGKGGLQDAATALIDAVEMGPGKFNAVTEKLTKPKWQNKVSELYINFLLSNPPTHVVNSVSNTLTALAQVPEFAAGSAFGKLRTAVMRNAVEDRILASEVGARAIGLLEGAKEGARLFAKALRTGEADDFVSKVEGEEYKAISGLKGEIIRTPTRLLTAEDQFFKGVARRMEINAQAVRIAHKEGLKGDAAKQRIAELSANPTDEMLAKALDYGRYLTFQRKTGEFGQGLSRVTASNLPAKVIVPFVRTPINLMKFATERSPAAPLLKEWRADFMSGGERRDLAVARVMLGTGMAMVMYEAALDGRITGAVPPDPAKAKLMYADGWQPYSIKIGDRYISYSRLDPLSTTIGVAADMATLPEGLSERQKDDKATMLVMSIMGNLASKTWLSGASAFTEALSDPGRYADNWLQRTAGAFAVPAGVAGAARQIDPVARKRESIWDAIKARTPGLSGDLLPRRDVFGEEIEIDSLGPDFISPFWQSQAKNDPVAAEMLRIGKSVSAPGKQYTEDGERLDYTPEQYDRYHEIAGRLTYNRLLGLVGSYEYSRLDDDGKRKAAKKAITAARKVAREALDDPDYPLPAKGRAPSGEWPGAPVDAAPSSEAWPGQPIASRDVVGDLKQAIPGVRFTSGFRDNAYNQKLKSRGYNAADNSEHLDGSSLDMLPPPGKSLSWLMDRVKRYDPEARLLVHDGHLHAAFNDYYGAPVLGGARVAGVRNPNAGSR